MNKHDLHSILSLVEADPEVLQAKKKLDYLQDELNAATDLVSNTAKRAEAASFVGESQEAFVLALTRYQKLQKEYSAELERLLTAIETR
jgi:hypothetical protein